LNDPRNKEGTVEYTPWASENGGWSDFASDDNYYDPDAVRVKIEARDYDGLIISNIMVGAWLTDCGISTRKHGEAVFSDWLSGDSTWSDWGSDDNWYDPDSYAIYMGVETNLGVSDPNSQGQLNAAFTIDDDESTSGLSTAEAVVLAVCIIGVVSCALGALFLCYKRRQKKVAFSDQVGDIDEEPLDNVIQKVSVEDKYDMRPVGVSMAVTGATAEEEVMVEVNVTETKD
jgi:hypothetical protein